MIHYLYARSFFKDIEIENENKNEYWEGQAGTYGLSKNKYMQAMIACALFQNNDRVTPAAIVRSLKDFSIDGNEPSFEKPQPLKSMIPLTALIPEKFVDNKTGSG